MPVTVRNTDILFNNGTTQSTAAVVDTTAVLNATAGASVGAVGTYAFLGETSTTETAAGGTRAGSALRYGGFTGADSAIFNITSLNVAVGNGGTPAGTWRCMGRSFGSGSPTNFGYTLWLRIS